MVTEKLNKEIKQWLKPQARKDQATIIKACIALYNLDGGELIIGQNDDGTPDITNEPPDIQKVFSHDIIQSLIAKHSSIQFEIKISYDEGKKQNPPQNYIAIQVPSGVKVPAYVKKGLDDPKGSSQFVLQANKVLVRSLSSNNTPSSSEPIGQDWDDLIERCVNNREADLAQIVKKYFAPQQLLQLSSFLQGTNLKVLEDNLLQNPIAAFIEKSRERYSDVIKKEDLKVPSHGAVEVGFIIEGLPLLPETLQSPTGEFLHFLNMDNPKHSGWPLWIVLKGATNEQEHPYVFNKGWESIVSIPTLSLDFWRVEPPMKFYHYRAFENDMNINFSQQALKSLDIDADAISYLAEAISTILTFTKNLNDRSQTKGLLSDIKIHMHVSWSGLKRRRLTSKRYNQHFIPLPQDLAHQDTISSTVIIPADATKGSIHIYIKNVTSDLFQTFGGLNVDENTIKRLTDNIISR